MRNAWLALGVVAALAAAGPAAAQSVLPVAIDLRGSLAFPMGDFGDDDEGAAGTGSGFGIDASLSLLPDVSVYAGWSRHAFGVDVAQPDLGGAFDYVDKGFHGGVQVGVPLALGGLRPWVKGGAVYHELEIDPEDDRQLVDEFDDLSTGHALGFEVGVGADIPLGLVISFTPQLAYRSYSADPLDGGAGDVRVSYLSAGLGMKFSF